MKFDILPVVPEMWETLKKMRLKALMVNPDVFSPSVNEFERSNSEWQNFVKNPKFQGFVLRCNNKAIGLTGIIEDRDYPNGDTGLFVMSFIDKEYRGKGLSKLLYEARINWAIEKSQYKRLIV